jgi:DNA repair exonuclease SbcCD ATPase subunit
MIFALGFLVAGLAALAFAPAFWQRANRLTRRQLEMQIPLSVQEILAERDQLRAEFAVERCRLEQQVDQLGQRHAAHLAAMGRQAARISGLEKEMAAKAAAANEADQRRVQSMADVMTMQAELGATHKALYDAEGLLKRKQEEFLEYIRLQESMKVLGEMRFAALAASDARVAGLELRLGDMSHNLIEAEKKLTQKELHARSLADVLSVVRHEREVAEAQLANLREQFEAEASRAGQLASDLAALRAQHDGDLSQLRTLMVKMNVNEAALEDALRREKDILAQRDLFAERVREGERALADKVAYLSSENAASQGALATARQRCEELESLLAKAQTAMPQSDAAAGEDTANLRQSISEIGVAIARLMRPNGDANGTAGAVTRPVPVDIPVRLTSDGGAADLLGPAPGLEPSHDASHEPRREPATF